MQYRRQRIMVLLKQAFPYSKRPFHRFHSYVDISKSVRDALSTNKPVVALESTIITHGMPYPANETTALTVENIVRQQGVVPATIGILNGRIKVGMNEEEISRLSKTDTETVKISRRDFPFVLSNSLNGGTTVAGTLMIAKKVGISIFVTGGIGGVHRDVNETMDISADLLELSRSPVCVVCSGVKSILDIGRTLELLETCGVCVVSYGSTKEFPAFYTRGSGFQSAYNVVDPKTAANLLFHSLEFESRSGILLGVPIPEEYAFEDTMIQKAISEALAAAKKNNISGKAITPFLLGKISQITDGKSLESNIALIKHNALIGSQIAVELSEKKRSARTPVVKNVHPQSYHTDKSRRANIVVVGGSMMDIVVQTDEEIEKDGRTLDGSLSCSAGGVGRNIADAVGRLQPSNPPCFISTVGDDTFGKCLLQSLEHVKSESVWVNQDETSASSLVMIDRQRDCSFLVADLKKMALIKPEQINCYENIISNSSLIVFDANMPLSVMEVLFELGRKYNVPVWFEPTDMTVAAKPLQLGSSVKIDYISPNFRELCTVAEYVTKKSVTNATAVYNVNSDTRTVVRKARELALDIVSHFPNIVISLGNYGLLIVKCENGDDVRITYYNPILAENSIVNASGAGDCLAAGYMVAVVQGLSEQECVAYGLSAAVQSLRSKHTVPSTLRYELLKRPLKYAELPVTGDFNLPER